jgi:predicted  nucleic acid-binding Zn-ribbon protein
MMKAEVSQQISLLELTEIDAELSRLAHKAAHLPEQERFEGLQADERGAADRLSVLGIAGEDVDAEVARLESEVDSVRKRADRDRGLLDSGSVNPKQLEELSHELDTLERRQISLEDSLLDVMERREQLATEQAGELAGVEDLRRELVIAEQARDQALDEIEQVRTGLVARRAAVVSELDAALVTLYDRQRAASGIGAGRLVGGRCGACRIELDRGEVARITAAPDDEVLRCSECGAILLRVRGRGE